MDKSVMPMVMSKYGIHSGGAQVELETCPSTQTSCRSVHDYQAKNAQKKKLAKSTSTTRKRFTRSGSRPTIASIAIWPRRACTAPEERNTAATIKKTEASSCQ